MRDIIFDASSPPVPAKAGIGVGGRLQRGSSKLKKFLIFWILIFTGCGLTLPSKISVHSTRLYYATTSDGWRVALFRFRPRAADLDRPPVLLVTSPTYNAGFWSLHPTTHFVRYLAKRGWDVWVLSLRGTGRSTNPGYAALDTFEDLPKTSDKRAGFEYKSYDWTLDDYIEKDMPAALKQIRAITGAKKITGIGAGFGASILLAYMATERDYFFDRAVAIAPPFKYVGPVPDIFSQIFNPPTAPSQPIQLTQVLFLNLANVDAAVATARTSFAMESIPPGVLKQFRDLVQKGELSSANRERNYFQSLRRIRRPVLLLCGKKDNLAPPEGVLEIYQRLSSKKKKIHEFGIANGCQVDYGHDDLILGRNAKKEVYPLIENWLKTTLKNETNH